METKTFTPSVNIIRDFSRDIDYIPTKNSNFIYNQIVSNYQKGTRSFNIVGSYGTGKSSFIVALEQSLNNKHNYFDRSLFFEEVTEFEFQNIVGESKSLLAAFTELFCPNETNPDSSKILKAISIHISRLNRKQKGFVLVIDEFGKYLEYAAKNNPESELYFIQQLAELINDKEKDAILLTVLHQNFNAYALGLSNAQQDEWNKVKGRLLELYFNEPVEQMLWLVSEKISRTSVIDKDEGSFIEIVDLSKKSKLFSSKELINLDLNRGLYPLDFFAANILTLSLQEYAQNERSIFSFIENEDNLGLKQFDMESNPFYNIACVYDYLNYYYYSFISTKYNPHLNHWNSIKESIERAEVVIESNQTNAIKLLKTIGLLSIFSSRGGIIDFDFLIDYSQTCLGINSPEEVIRDLERNKIIKFTSYNKQYRILQGTDLDIELAINNAGNLIERIKDFATHLNKYFEFPIIPVKEYSYNTGTPRFFSFIISEEPTSIEPVNELDGYINLIFNSHLNDKDVLKSSSLTDDAILYGLYKNTEKIENTLYEIEKIKKVIENNQEDKVALKELGKILHHYKVLLNHYVIDSMFSADGSVSWFFNGKRVMISDRRDLNKLLSEICTIIYPTVPVFKNEMVNKTKISGTISSSRKKLIKALLENPIQKDLGFEKDKFPAEKSIFLSLIKHSGIYKENKDTVELSEPTEESFLNTLECLY
jgi:hypothetical protein